MRWKHRMLLTMTALALGVVPSVGPRAQEQDQARGVITPQAGFFTQSGGTVRGKRARTQTASSTIAESATWVDLPGAALQWTVPAGTTDLFNVTFSAEGRLFSGGADDYLRIRIFDTLVGAPLEPYDGAQAFLSADSYATHTGNWATRAAAGIHTLQVQIWIFDGAPAEVVSAWLDDWTFELVVYD